MTSTNMDAPSESVAAFKNLPVDDQASGASVTRSGWLNYTSNFKDDFTRSFCGFVTQIEQMSQQEQLLALRDLHWSSPLTLEYQSLDTNSSWLCGIS